MTTILQEINPHHFWDNSDYAKKTYIGEPLTDALLDSVEKSLGYTLPKAYVELMRHQNGGTPRYKCHRMAEPTSWAPNHIAIKGIFGIGREKSLSLCGSDGHAFWLEEWLYPPIGIYFADSPSGGHDMLCLDYRKCGPHGEPEVVHVDQESDYEITFVARSFQDFILGLEPEDAFLA